MLATTLTTWALFLTLVQVEEGLRLLGVANSGHDDVVEVGGRTLDDVEMAVGDRIE